MGVWEAPPTQVMTRSTVRVLQFDIFKSICPILTYPWMDCGLPLELDFSLSNEAHMVFAYQTYPTWFLSIKRIGPVLPYIITNVVAFDIKSYRNDVRCVWFHQRTMSLLALCLGRVRSRYFEHLHTPITFGLQYLIIISHSKISGKVGFSCIIFLGLAIVWCLMGLAGLSFYGSVDVSPRSQPPVRLPRLVTLRSQSSGEELIRS